MKSGLAEDSVPNWELAGQRVVVVSLAVYPLVGRRDVR
jgi:hypothetical protein